VVYRRDCELGYCLVRVSFAGAGNRIGYTQLSLAQLKVTQEVITLSVFAPFAVLYMRQPLKLDYLWAGLCLLGAVYFMFRS
jgi:uncharacterized protein (DUF486 family)